MKKDKAKTNTSANSEKRPKFQNLKSSSKSKDKPESIARTAQPGNVMLPRAVFYRTDLQPSERLVAGWLYDHLKPGTNTATGSQDTIALEMGLAKGTVIKAIDTLWEKHIIISVEKHLKMNGYYLSYDMRLFPSEETRKRSRPRSTKTLTNSDKPKAAKNDKTKLSSANPQCQSCYGTGWHILPNKQGTKICDCRIS
jgi:hypothetical protein